MSRFKKNKRKGGAAISTASLPDIIFMLLFFFMITTVMRETELLVDVKQPEANELVKLENRKLVAHIYIGTPVKAGLGKEPRIQLDDQLVNDATKVRQWLDLKKGKLSEEEAAQMVVSLKVDAKTKMGIVNRVKYELRDNLQFRINYSAGTPKVAE
jgi:biopolymer transport protein ExbD